MSARDNLPEPLFADRRSAGLRLAQALKQSTPQGPPPLVVALPRGGVPVALPVAQALGAPLDVLVVRKLGAPGREELALGAIASGGAQLLNDDLVWALRITDAELQRVRTQEQQELRRRERAYRGARPRLSVRGRHVVLVDDGIATGATMRVAVAALRQDGAARVTVATPVASREAADLLRREADEVVCLATPEPFTSVGAWYLRFPQTTDAEVAAALAQAGPAP